MKAFLIRLEDDGKQTCGHLILFDGVDKMFSCCTLEPPWKNNEVGVSCISPGYYTMKPFNSPKFGKCLTVTEVEGRSQIRVHAGNYFYNSRGCIMPGRDFQDLNQDGHKDVTFSSATLASLLQFVKEEIELVVIGCL